MYESQVLDARFWVLGAGCEGPKPVGVLKTHERWRAGKVLVA